MSNISLQTANLIHTYASITAITAAFIAASSGVITYMASSVQSRYNDQAIANANSVSAQANNAAAQAKVTSEELVKKNIELSIELEKERQERLKMESSLSRRSLTPQQKEILSENLKKVSGISKIVIHIAQQESEVINYGEEMILAFAESGIDVTVVKVNVLSLGSSTGVRATIYNGPGHDAIEYAIAQSGFASVVHRAPLQPPQGARFTHDPNLFAAKITIFPKPPHL